MNVFEQVTQFHFQCSGNFADVLEANVLRSSFNAANVCAVEIAKLRKPLLTNGAFLTPPPYRFAELNV